MDWLDKLFGALLFPGILTALALIFWFLHKGNAKYSFVGGIFLIIAIPVWLDKIILYKWYLAFPWESSRDPEEWMDFLGSYLGVLGTVAVGILAFWQTEVNRKQDQKIEEQKQEIEKLQKQIAAYQIRPSIHFKGGKLKAYVNAQHKQTNQNIYRQLYYKSYGGQPLETPSIFVCISISFHEKGLVPVKRFRIKEIRWIINDVKYTIIPGGRKSEERDLPAKKLRILIDDKDEVTKSGSNGDQWHEFISAVTNHQGFYADGSAGFDVSQLTVKMNFVNQIGESREYKVTYPICSKKSGMDLFLQNPHILVLESFTQGE